MKVVCGRNRTFQEQKRNFVSLDFTVVFDFASKSKKFRGGKSNSC